MENPLYGAVCEYFQQADERIVFRALPRQVTDALGLDLRPTPEALVAAMRVSQCAHDYLSR